MSWLDNLFGAKSAKRDADGTYAANKAIFKEAQGNELEQLGLARKYALAALQGGYDTSRGDLLGGRDAAAGFLDRGFDAAGGMIRDGYGNAISASEDYLKRTSNVLDPYLTAGSKARDAYYNALGLNGDAARDQFYSSLSTEIANNPIYQQGLELQNKGLERSAAASGIGGGRLAAAYARAAQEKSGAYMADRLNRLEGQSNLGGQFANTLAGYTNQTGQQVAGYNAAMGTALAGNEASRGTSQATNAANFSNLLANNATGFGQNQANVNMQSGNNLANTYARYANLDAQNRSAYGNAYAATRGSGLNNLISAGATALMGWNAFNRPQVGGYNSNWNTRRIS